MVSRDLSVSYLFLITQNSPIMFKFRTIKKALNIVLYRFLYLIARNGIIYQIACIENRTKTSSPILYTWDEEYFNRIEYLRRRSLGEDITFHDVEEEYLRDWAERIKYALEQLKTWRENQK